MASVTVYGPPISTAVSRVLACLHEKQVPYQLAAVDMAKGQHKSPDFLKLQPFGKVPAFKDENTSLFESRAICRYICDKYADQGYQGLHGRSLLDRAWVEQWLEAEAQNFNPPTSVLVFQLAFAPRMGLKQDPKVIEENEGKLAKVLDVYDRRLGEQQVSRRQSFYPRRSLSPPRRTLPRRSKPSHQVEEECGEVVGGDIVATFLEEGCGDAERPGILISSISFC